MMIALQERHTFSYEFATPDEAFLHRSQAREFRAKKLAVQTLKFKGLSPRHPSGAPTAVFRGWIEYYANQLAFGLQPQLDTATLESPLNQPESQSIETE